MWHSAERRSVPSPPAALVIARVQGTLRCSGAPYKASPTRSAPPALSVKQQLTSERGTGDDCSRVARRHSFFFAFFLLLFFFCLQDIFSVLFCIPSSFAVRDAPTEDVEKRARRTPGKEDRVPSGRTNATQRARSPPPSPDPHSLASLLQPTSLGSGGGNSEECETTISVEDNRTTKGKGSIQNRPR